MRGEFSTWFLLAILSLAAGAFARSTLAAETAQQQAPQEVAPEGPARAAGLLSDDLPALISADQITYDQNLGVVTATGNVEVSQDERVLRADTISYSQHRDVVSASGNVSLLDPSGDVLFADFVELTGDLKEGFIRDIRVLMSDKSRMAAATALRTGDNRTVFRRAVFSPCQPCREDPDRAPLWQIKAAKVVHDQENHTIRYSNAWMEIFGVPVMYLPYFEHPDPTVERKTGFLSPTFGTSETLGAVVQVPYHWAISPNLDATFEPIFTTKQSIVLAGEYRHLLPFGRHEFRGSGTIAEREKEDGTIEKDALRGHIEATGIYEINESWRTGFALNRSSDDTYLRLYDFGDSSFLTSNLYLERLRGRNYAAFNAFSFQGLREGDDTDESPIVAPLMDYNFISEPWVADSTFKADANALVLTRLEGRDVRRLSAKAGLELPFTDPIGGIYTLATTVQADGYWSNEFEPGNDEVNPSGPTETELSGRVFPQLAAKWRYPWVSYGGFLDQVIEPVAQVVVGPNFGNPKEIPNEDSLDFEFDDTNLFSLNRFPGLDRVDPGQRVDYGLQWKGIFSNGGQTGVFAGQSFRLQEEKRLFPEDSGVQDNFSDVVGRLNFNPIRDFDLLYRFRLDKDSLAPRRHEVDFRVGPPALNLNADYLFVGSEAGTGDFGDREEIKLRLNTRLNENWSGFGFVRRDLELDDTRRVSVGVSNEDECFFIQLVGKRDFDDDREISSEDSIFVRVSFKHLGGVSSK